MVRALLLFWLLSEVLSQLTALTRAKSILMCALDSIVLFIYRCGTFLGLRSIHYAVHRYMFVVR
jgi:hypothetical protein